MIMERKFFLLLDKIVLDEKKKLDSEIKFQKKNYMQEGNDKRFSLLDDFEWFLFCFLLFCLYIVQRARTGLPNCFIFWRCLRNVLCLFVYFCLFLINNKWKLGKKIQTCSCRWGIFFKSGAVNESEEETDLMYVWMYVWTVLL